VLPDLAGRRHRHAGYEIVATDERRAFRAPGRHDAGIVVDEAHRGAILPSDAGRKLIVLY
jgi:hypothetical protein